MSRHHNIVIVCDHGRKGDGRIEHKRCDLVAPIIWVDETQGWLPQAPAVGNITRRRQPAASRYWLAAQRVSPTT